MCITYFVPHPIPSLTFEKEECKSSESEQVTQRNVTLIVRKAQNPIFISAVFCLKYCQSRKGSKLNNWELIAPAKRLNQNCDAECLSECNSPDSSLCPLSCLSLRLCLYSTPSSSLFIFFICHPVHNVMHATGKTWLSRNTNIRDFYHLKLSQQSTSRNCFLFYSDSFQYLYLTQTSSC